MGFARIISGGPTGRYTVELDYGDAMRIAALAAITSRLTQIDSQILLVQASLIDAEGREAALRADIQAQSEELIALMQATNGQPGPAGTAITKYIAELQRQLGRLLAANQPIRDQLSALKFERANWRRKATQFNTMQTKVQRQAWCTDLTEDIPALAYVATCDVPGDPNLVLLAPGGRAWQASDGEFRARELLSPAQAFANTAIFPGWQKWKPTYRWGTITSVDYDANRVNVALFDQKSDAQRVPVNQASALSNVVVSYMDCDALAFKVNDRVLIQFQDQNWSNPRVIGFLDNPQPCIEWPDVTIALSLEDRDVSAASSRTFIMNVNETFRCGPNATVGTVRCARSANVYGKWGNPSIIDPPSPHYTANMTPPTDVMVGAYNWQVYNLSDPFPSPIAQFSFGCAGTSPAKRVDLSIDALDSSKIKLIETSAPFAAESWQTWDTIVSPPTCTLIGSGSDLRFSATSQSIVYNGPPTAYFGTPTLSLTFDNGVISRTRNYILKSVNGTVLTYGPAPLPT